MRVVRWGNSLAVRLPAALVEVLKLKEGDDIEVHIADEREWLIRRKPSKGELLRGLHAFRGRLPADDSFGRDELHRR